MHFYFISLSINTCICWPRDIRSG